MKKFWLVLLSLGLIMAFSVSAFAVDVQVSGEYYAAGMYLDKTSFRTTDENPWYVDLLTQQPAGGGYAGHSTAFFFQRLRVGTDFIVSPCLKLVTRFDAMERIWGGSRSTPGSSGNLGGVSQVGTYADYDIASAGTTAENQNIAFDYVYIDYTSPIGLFRVGYQQDEVWGTVFADSSKPLGRITYAVKVGPWTGLAYIGKFKDVSYSAVNTSGWGSDRVDADIDQYVLAGVYSFKGGSTGLLAKHVRSAYARDISALGVPYGLKQQFTILIPYIKAQFGPVKIQSEILYGFGDYAKWEDDAPGAILPNSKLENLAGWVDATADLGKVYVGGSVAYVSGDDGNTLDKKEGGIITGGMDWNPCLILFNSDLYYWAGAIPGYNGTQNPNLKDYTLKTDDTGMTNAWFLQGRVGVKPTPQWDIVASLSHAWVDKKPVFNRGYLSPASYVAGLGGNPTESNGGTYGTEIDVTATYKITNNLTYMLGAAYLFTGDYFKGTGHYAIGDPRTVDREVDDNYMLINKLTLNF